MKAVLVVVGVLAVLLAGCASPNVPGATVEKGKIVFKADGTAVAAKEGDPLALEEARLAAATIAKANLLELIKGAFVTSKVTVEGLMLESESAALSTQGFLSRTTIAYGEEPKVPPPAVVKATATLTLSKKDYMKLKDYVE
jgi:outer membrane protein W